MKDPVILGSLFSAPILFVQENNGHILNMSTLYV